MFNNSNSLFEYNSSNINNYTLNRNNEYLPLNKNN